MEVSVQVIEKPYLMGKEEQEALVRKCYPLVCQGFVQEPSDEVFEDTWNHVRNCMFLWLYTEGGELKVFTTWDVYEFDFGKVLYLGGIMVSPQTQGKGVGSRLTKQAWGQYGGDFLVAQTQNPVLYSTLSRTGFTVYPSLDGKSLKEIACLAEQMVTVLGWPSSVGQNPQIRYGVYGKSLYGKRPVNHHDFVESFFENSLNLDQGDAFVLFAKE